MTVQNIILYPDPLLKVVCDRARPEDQRVLSLIADLIDTMRAGRGSVGIAAPQIGMTLRVCVVDVSAHKLGKESHGLLVLVNPEILSRQGAGIMREGCMSVPDYTGDVERAQHVSIRFADMLGGVREIEANGFEAVAIQHEIDHLDGILFLDRVTSVKTGLFRRKNYR